MGHRPERTCIGCREVFTKDKVVRIVGGPGGPVVDYRERLPGRAAYVCPRHACIVKALSRDQLSRALRSKVGIPEPNGLIDQITVAIRQRIVSLLTMTIKAGKLAAGFSAVDDALRKGRGHLLLFATDISSGTKEKIRSSPGVIPSRQIELFTTQEIGGMAGRELVSAVAILDEGFANALWSEWERLKGLINTHA
jgi:predicted RNA-binding protein YlxR (DUF448 family)